MILVKVGKWSKRCNHFMRKLRNYLRMHRVLTCTSHIEKIFVGAFTGKYRAESADTKTGQHQEPRSRAIIYQ